MAQTNSCSACKGVESNIDIAMNWSRVASYHNYISTLICHTTAACCHGNVIVQALCSRLAHLVSTGNPKSILL